MSLSRVFHIQPTRARKEQFDRFLDIEDGHPVDGELGREGIKSRVPAKHLLVDTHANVEGAYREHRDNQRSPIEERRLSDGRGLAGTRSSSY
jgi:hypothetical protein